MLGDAVPLTGVPDGCVARPSLVADGADGWRLPRDRSGRIKLTTVELTAAADAISGQALDAAEWRFLLGRETRRWPTVVDHYGSDAAGWSAAVTLCRAGLVTITCSVVATRLGPPTRWRWAEATRGHDAERQQRLANAGDVARALLAGDGGEPAWVETWLRDVTRSGLVARSPDESESLLTSAAGCLAALPSAGNSIGRGELAARHGGARGAHALDDGHRLTALVLRGIATITGQPYPRTAGERRALWASVGVVCDTTSATVLVANLRPEADGLVARQLMERADACLPTHLTARDLAVSSLRLPGRAVYVCENPRVLEAALDRGVTAALVCTAGNPTTVTVELLRQLATGGAHIAYRGDFDWPGLAIANRVIERTACRTWQYDVNTYLAAVEQVDGDVVPLNGKPVPAIWDDRLCDAMQQTGAAIHEELLLDQLVTYLADT